jgi:hypothetical protein
MSHATAQKSKNEGYPPMSKKPLRKGAPKFNLYQVVTYCVIASLKAGVIPWGKAVEGIKRLGDHLKAATCYHLKSGHSA